MLRKLLMAAAAGSAMLITVGGTLGIMGANAPRGAAASAYLDA